MGQHNSIEKNGTMDSFNDNYYQNLENCLKSPNHSYDVGGPSESNNLVNLLNDSIDDNTLYFSNIEEVKTNIEKNDDKGGKNKKSEKSTNTSKKSTSENSLMNKFSKSNKKKRTFKNKENMGRNKKNNSSNNIQKNKKSKKTRDKKAPDNLRMRYKRSFFNSLIEFLNSKIAKCPKLLKKRKLYKLHEDVIKNNKKEKIQLMLRTSAREFLSLDITQKVQKKQKCSNKNLIDDIYKIKEETKSEKLDENIKDLIEIMDKTINDLMDIYRNNEVKNDKYKDFKRLSFFIENKLEKEDENYKILFLDQSLNYETKIELLDGRNESKDIDFM